MTPRLPINNLCQNFRSFFRYCRDVYDKKQGVNTRPSSEVAVHDIHAEAGRCPAPMGSASIQHTPENPVEMTPGEMNLEEPMDLIEKTLATGNLSLPAEIDLGF